MIQYATTTRALAEAFEHEEFKQISREKNTNAYIVAKLRSSSAEGTSEQPIIGIEMLSICKSDAQMIEERVQWMTPIIQFNTTNTAFCRF